MVGLRHILVALATLAVTLGWPTEQNDAELFEHAIKFARELEIFKNAFHGEEVEMRDNISLVGFKWLNCHKGADIDVTDMKFPTDPIPLPGTVQVGGAVTVKETIENITEVVVNIHKNTWLGWFEVPCEKNVGSCTYTGICDMLEKVECPPALVKAGITCRCPLKGGSYEVPLTTIKTPQAPVPAVLINGLYKVRATIKNANAIVGCYEVQVSIKEQ